MISSDDLACRFKDILIDYCSQHKIESAELIIKYKFGTRKIIIIHEKILPCPFCGSEAELIEHESDDGRSSYFMVRCKGGKMHQLDYCGDTPEDTINEWNERVVK